MQRICAGSFASSNNRIADPARSSIELLDICDSVDPRQRDNAAPPMDVARLE